MTRVKSRYAAGAIARGSPGWPLLAACTASIARVRIVLMLRRSRSALMPAVYHEAGVAQTPRVGGIGTNLSVAGQARHPRGRQVAPPRADHGRETCSDGPDARIRAGNLSERRPALRGARDARQSVARGPGAMSSERLARARSIASCRERTSSLRRMFFMCERTVSSDRKSET